ncbi:hypothetical protein DIPPA_29502 [Diplonema papillatum]|nr:hypothetical protein DIPPA_29502 [Diplonema papillatum]
MVMEQGKEDGTIIEAQSNGIHIGGVFVEYEHAAAALGIKADEGPAPGLQTLTRSTQLFCVVDRLVNLAYMLWLFADGREKLGVLALIALTFCEAGVTFFTEPASSLKCLYSGPQKLRMVSCLLPIVDFLHLKRACCFPQTYPWTEVLLSRHVLLGSLFLVAHNVPLYTVQLSVRTSMRPVLASVHLVFILSASLLLLSLRRSQQPAPPYLNAFGLPPAGYTTHALLVLVIYVVVMSVAFLAIQNL